MGRTGKPWLSLYDYSVVLIEGASSAQEALSTILKYTTLYLGSTRIEHGTTEQYLIWLNFGESR